MRGIAKLLIAVLVLGGIVSYLVLPAVIEDQLASRLQQAFGAPTKPYVEVSSNFPPELLLGRIDRIQVEMDQMNLQGAPLYNARADLRDVRVSVPSLLEGSPRIESQGCSMSVEVPAFSTDQNQQCLSFLGLAPAW